MGKNSISYLNFTNEVTKILRETAKKERIICNVNPDGSAIYISNGHLVFKMNKWEYETLVQPVTMTRPGDFTYCKRDGMRPEVKPTIIKIFEDDAKSSDLDDVNRAPLQFTVSECTVTGFYNPKRKASIFINAAYAAAIVSGSSYKGTSGKAPVMCYRGSEAIALFLPVHIKDEHAADAVKAYFVKPGSTKEADLEKQLAAAQTAADELKTRVQTAEALYQEAAAENAALKENASATPAATTPDAKTAAEIIMERLASLDGVTATIKGAQTAAPVIWLSGETEKHEDAIKEAGGRWSTKKSAWYVKAA